MGTRIYILSLIVTFLAKQTFSFFVVPPTLSSRPGHTMTFSANEKPSTEVNQSLVSSDESKSVPKLVVFDLDNTLWTPELYQLRKLERAKMQPVAGKDVKLFPTAKAIIDSIRSKIDSTDTTWSNTKFAIASRTKSVAWAHDLLKQFGLYDFFDYMEIFPGGKKDHFANLKEMSGIPYSEMLFFDDSRDGKFGNCVPVSQLGVLSVHCPNGIYTDDIWTNALDHYHDWSNHCTPNTIIEWDGSITSNGQSTNKKSGGKLERLKGEVKFVNEEKRFGFIRYGDRNTPDMFFHFSSLPNTVDSVERGDKVTFSIEFDSRKGKSAAADLQVEGAETDNDEDQVQMRVFSMNLPFAALLANGYKTLETRNGTMFTPYPEGTHMLLHVGQRIYPDGDRHLDVMKSGGLNDEEISTLKSLPKGYGKGMAVAIVELGETFETTLEERCDPDFQRSVGAFGADSGMRATVIKRVDYLKRGVKVSGRGGVFKARINKDVLPDGW